MAKIQSARCDACQKRVDLPESESRSLPDNWYMVRVHRIPSVEETTRPGWGASLVYTDAEVCSPACALKAVTNALERHPPVG